MKTVGRERVRYWVKELFGIHSELDIYLEGQFLGSEWSDIVGEHIFLTEGNTNNIDIKDYFIDNSTLQPYPIRATIKYKVPDDTLKMMELGYVEVNKKYGKTLSIYYKDRDTNEWYVPHAFAHDKYNAPDVFGMKLKREMQYMLLEEFINILKEREKLSNLNNPVKENIIVENEYMTANVEGKPLIVDIYFNKIVTSPATISEEFLKPKGFV